MLLQNSIIKTSLPVAIAIAFVLSDWPKFRMVVVVMGKGVDKNKPEEDKNYTKRDSHSAAAEGLRRRPINIQNKPGEDSTLSSLATTSGGATLVLLGASADINF
ncbi:hypothetical protein K1719_012911 [Acacia pycnantha]|nr:hypothetical protein K1719_012911 [Acacia pycnantha]